MLVGLSGAGWAALALLPTTALPGACGGLGAEALLDSRYLALLAALNPPGAVLLGWLAMATAMMLPLLAGELRHVAERAGSTAGPVLLALGAAFVAVWVLAMPLLELAGAVLAAGFGPAALPTMVIFAGAWQHTRLKRRACNRVHAVPVLPGRLPGQVAVCLRHGCRAGGWCLVSCWAAMLAAMTARSGVAAVLVALLLWYERFTRRGPLLLPELAAGRRFSRPAPAA